MVDIEVHIHGTCAAGGSNNRLTDAVFHFNRTTYNSPLGTKAQFDAAFQTNIVTPIAAALNHRWTQTRNSVRYLNDVNDAFVDFSHALPGLITGDSMTTVQAAFLLFRTGIRGKSYLGKKHMFPISEADTTAGADDLLNTAALTLWGNVITAVLAGFSDASGNTWKSTVYSRKLSSWRANPTTIINTPITAGLINKRVGRMRHREVLSQY
jgi:hypothetical protein